MLNAINLRGGTDAGFASHALQSRGFGTGTEPLDVSVAVCMLCVCVCVQTQAQPSQPCARVLMHAARCHPLPQLLWTPCSPAKRFVLPSSPRSRTAGGWGGGGRAASGLRWASSAPHLMYEHPSSPQNDTDWEITAGSTESNLGGKKNTSPFPHTNQWRKSQTKTNQACISPPAPAG